MPGKKLTKKESKKATKKADLDKAKKQLHFKKNIPDVELVIIGKGKNTHVKVPFGESYQIDNQVYTPEREFLLMRKRWGRKSRFVAVFKEDGTPVSLAPEMVKRTVKDNNGKLVEIEVPQRVTAETLYIAEKSQSLHNGLSELFSNPANTKKLMFIMIIAVIGVAAYMFMSGAVTI